MIPFLNPSVSLTPGDCRECNFIDGREVTGALSYQGTRLRRSGPAFFGRWPSLRKRYRRPTWSGSMAKDGRPRETASPLSLPVIPNFDRASAFDWRASGFPASMGRGVGGACGEGDRAYRDGLFDAQEPSGSRGDPRPSTPSA